MAKPNKKSTLDKKIISEIVKKLPDKTLFNRLIDDENAQITNECLSQMNHVVDYLYDNQMTFRVEQSTSGGYLQLHAVTDSPKSRIVLTGKPEHIDFIGSGLKSSQRYAFTTTPYDGITGGRVGGAGAVRTYRPSKEDVVNLLNAYLKNDMKAFATPNASHSLAFNNGRSQEVPNVYYQAGNLKKSYRTFTDSNGHVLDVELRVEPTTGTYIDGETTDLSSSVKVLSNAIMNSRDYLVSEIKKAAPLISGQVKFTKGQKVVTPSDYGIDNSSIIDMVMALKNECSDVDSEYGIELAESSDASIIDDIITDYVSTKILGLSKSENGDIVSLPVVDMNDRDYVATENDIPTGFTIDANAIGTWSSITENEANTTSRARLQSAMRGVGLTAENIVGSDNRNANIADSLIKFDESTSKSKDDYAADSFEKRLLDHTEEHLRQLGIEATCRFDANGLIDIAGTASGITGNTSRTVPVHAQIGQIFAPDEHNVVHVRRNRGDDFLFVPGYRAFIEENAPGENKNLMERTVLTGYFQSATMYIDSALSTLISSTAKALKPARADVNQDVNVMLPTVCNSVYGETYGTRLAGDHMESMLANGFDEEDVNAIYAALSGKIAYSREMDNEATTINSIGGESQRTRALEIAGQNLREMGEECSGFVYPNMTNTGRGSGTRRYLIATSSVSEDGHIIKGNEADITSPLFSRPMFSGVDHNALDRNVMAFSQIMDAQGIAKNAKGAHMTIEGWTLDDGYVISKEFAESHTVRTPEVDEDGNSIMRPLMTGDKISDMNGNKGVINIVIDRNMSAAEAKREKIESLVDLIKLNPDIDFIGAPFSGMSRSNAGTALSMMADAEDLKLPNGEIVKGGIGTLPMLITGMTVDTKTHTYEENSDHQRNSSGQLSWMLSSKKLDAISKEIYGTNDTGLGELRAYLNIIGSTVDEKGVLHRGLGSNSGSINQVQLVDDMSEDDGSGRMKVKRFNEFVLDTNPRPEKIDRLQIKSSAAKWDAEAKDFNGLLSLPFPVHGADGKPITVEYIDENKKTNTIPVMPVISASYRSSVSYDNGETFSHDYTKNYAKIIRAAGEYMSAATRMSKAISSTAASFGGFYTPGQTEADIQKDIFNTLSSPDASTLMKNPITIGGQTITMSQYMNQAVSKMSPENRDNFNKMHNDYNAAKVAGQSEYANIVNDTVTKKFEDRKHGAVSSALVKVGCKHSATAVWTADPRLELDEVAMSQTMYDALKIKDNHVLIWRDPLLRDTGLRYQKVVIDNNLTGIAVNPMIAKGFDGDFDGDSLAVVAFETVEAQREAAAKLSIKANILDYGVGDEGHHPLLLQDGMDIKAALHANTALKDTWKDLEKRANEEYSKDGIVSDATFDDIKKMSKDILKSSSYHNIMDYSTPNSVAESLLGMSKEFGNGSKGSIGKMKGFMKYMGFDVDVDKKGSLDVKPSPMTEAERFDHNRNVCIALGCKCDETGVAGYASQKAIRALRDVCPTEALELTYPVTQGMLQAKHDAAEAKLKADLTQNVIPDLWEGKRLLQDNSGHWNVEHASNNFGRSVAGQATAEQWKDQFMRIMCQANGINIDTNADTKEVRANFAGIMNPTALDIVAANLTDQKTNTIIGVSDKAAQHSSFIDNAMYGVANSSDVMGSKPIVDYIMSEADKNTNIFANGGEVFAPISVRIANNYFLSLPETQHSLNDAYVKESQSGAVAYAK